MSKFKLYRTNPDSPSIDLDSHIQEIKNLETAINAPEQIDYIENNKAQLTTACQRYAMDLVFELGRIVRINDRLMQEDILSAQSSPSEKKSAFQSLKEKLAPLDEQAQKLLKTQANYLETTARIKQQYHIITGRTRLQEYNRNFSTLSRTIDETRKKIGRDETILDASISREHLAEYEGKLGKIDKKDEVEFSSSDKLGEKKTGLKDSDVPMLETAIQNREKFIAGLADWRKKVSDIQTIIQKELDNALKTEKDLVTYRISGNAGSGGFKTLQATIALMQNNADISQGLAKQEIYEKTAQKDTIVAAAASREKMTQHEKDLNAIPQMNQTQFSALTKAGAKNKRTSTTSVYEDDIKTYTKAIEEREAFLKKLPDYLKQLSALEEAIETNARNAIIIQTNIEKYALGVTAGTVEAEALKKRITSLKETAQKDKQDITNELPDYRKTLNQKKLRQEEETLMASIDNEVTQIQSLRRSIDKKTEPQRFFDMLTPEHKKLSTLNKEAEILKEALKKVDEKPNIDKTGTDAEKKLKEDLEAITKRLDQQGSETSSLRSESQTQAVQPETSSLQSGDRKATWTFKTSPKKVDKKTKIDKTATKAEKPPKKDLAAIEKHLKQQGSETSSLRSESRTQTEQSETSSLQSGDKEANNTTFDTSSENWSADEEEKEEVQSNNMTSSSGTPASIYTYGFQVDEKGGIMSSLDNFITTFKPMHADTKALLTVSELTGASVFIKKNGGFECLTSHETMTNDPVTMCIVKGGKWLTCEMRDISPIAPATHLDQPSPRTLHLQQNLLSVSSA